MRGSPTRRAESDLAARKSRAARTWLAVCAGAAFLAIFVFIAYEARTGTFVTAWDGYVTDALVASRSGVWSRVFWGVTLLGNMVFMTACLSAVVVLLLAWGRWRSALLLVVGTGLAQVVSSAAKAIIDRPRPPVSLALIQQPGSQSLPSGHAFTTLVVAGLLLHLLFRRTGTYRSPGDGSARRWVPRIVGIVVSAALLLLVGTSRVYLGVHWASDVIGGWCLGALWLILVLGFSRRWRWDEWPIGPHSRLGTGWRIGLVILVVAVVGVAFFLTARADALL